MKGKPGLMVSGKPKAAEISRRRKWSLSLHLLGVMKTEIYPLFSRTRGPFDLSE